MQHCTNILAVPVGSLARCHVARPHKTALALFEVVWLVTRGGGERQGGRQQCDRNQPA